MQKSLFFTIVYLSCLAYGMTARADEKEVKAKVTFKAVDYTTKNPHVNASYGSIEFYALDEQGNKYYPNHEGTYTFTQKGSYTLQGDSIYNFCYSDSAKVYVDEHTISVNVYLYISCE